MIYRVVYWVSDEHRNMGISEYGERFANQYKAEKEVRYLVDNGYAVCGEVLDNNDEVVYHYE